MEFPLANINTVIFDFYCCFSPISMKYLHLQLLIPYFEGKIVKTRPCEQGNWDTWMVLDPWNQV